MCPRNLLLREMTKRYQPTSLSSMLRTKLDTSVMQVQERLLIAILETINTSKAAMGMAKTHQVATINEHNCIKGLVYFKPYCIACFKCEDILIFLGEGGGCFQQSRTDLPPPLTRSLQARLKQSNKGIKIVKETLLQDCTENIFKY